jgi:hypothetical protein
MPQHPRSEEIARTTYIAHPFGSEDGILFELRVGQQHPRFDLLVDRECGAGSWAIVGGDPSESFSAMAPSSRAGHRRLWAALDGRAIRVWRGYGEAEGSKARPVWIAVGISRADALLIARELGQGVIVYSERGQPAEVLFPDEELALQAAAG